jgi:hypothetical protein
MSELTVPTVPLTVKIECRDGKALAGRVFVPASAPTHAGPIRADDWINEPALFFPFLPDGAPAPILINKRDVVVMEVPAEADVSSDSEAGVDFPVRRLLVELGDRQIEGSVVIEMPETHSRVLDVLNLPTAFLTLRQDGLHMLVQKARISRVSELQEA